MRPAEGIAIAATVVALGCGSGGEPGVGYSVASKAHGRGVAMRELRILAAWAFDELGLGRLELRDDTANSACGCVAERAGFTREGVLRGYRYVNGRRADMVLFARVRGDAR